MKSPVIFVPTQDDDFGPAFQQQLKLALGLATDGLDRTPTEPWVIKVPLGSADPLSAELMELTRTAFLEAGFTTGPYLDNLSITTEGLDTTQGLLSRAGKLGLDNFQVGDDPQGAPSETLLLSDDCSLASVGLPPVAAEAAGLLLINGVRPHPFLGLGGALFALGSDLLDRATKIRLHRAVKPKVDTPLCAGCGSCLGACIFDAITFKGGRASIDHKLCTGCGECMGACHLGGIGPENGMDILRYQKMVAESGGAVALKSRAGLNGSLFYINFLTPLPRQAGGSFGRDRFLKENIGALLSTDPVALDQATWDLLVQDAVHGLRQWSGFLQEPAPLMERAEALGMGRRQYNLIIQN